VNRIPRFVQGHNYADHFGYQWNQFRTTQLDSYTGLPITSKRLQRCLGPELWNNLSNMDVLECGCGAGRFTEVLLHQGARVTSLDLSSAVEANATNFPVTASHRIVQADINRMPFRENSYDLVLCLGVVQHTPDPRQTVAQLYRYVKPGGTVVVDHYRWSLAWYTKTAPLFRMVLKRLPTATSMKVIERMVDTMLPLHKWASRNRVSRAIVGRVSPLLTFYVLYPELNDRLQREWAMLDTHDSLTDWYKHRRSKEQVVSMLKGIGMHHIHAEYAGNGVEARGRKPLTAS
jgi:2-polyprenyl-3-methyl-5-hydroxy-6-metoxy-1,4-benzoquinol methylase